MRTQTLRRFLMIVLAACLGCDTSPVTWDEAQRLAGAPAASESIATSRAGHRGCAGSPVTAAGRGSVRYEAWWEARSDSSVVLRVRREAGAAAATLLTADARDRGRRGCARPAPAIAVDTTGGYVQLAYFLEPAEGEGVWTIHYMERDGMWHAPVPIAFGPDPAAAAVTAASDSLLVAFESPNAADGWIGLAFSSSDGHIIDWTEGAISGRSVPARDPRVERRRDRIVVTWTTRASALEMARAGTLRAP